MEYDVDTRREIVGDKRWHTHAEVDIIAILHFFSGSFGDLNTTLSRFLLSSIGSTGRLGLGSVGNGYDLDLLFVLTLDDPIDEDRRQMDLVRTECTTGTISSASTMVILAFLPKGALKLFAA